MDTSYHNLTNLHPGVVAAVAVACLWILIAARRHALLPLLALACFVSPAQRLVIGGLDFTVTKILVLAFVLRIVARQELRGVRWNRIDGAVVAWIAISTLCFVGTRGTFEAVVNRLGWAVDVFGVYLVFRAAIRDRRDLERAVRGFAWCALPVAALFAVELVTAQNPFGDLGGVGDAPLEREGKLRCQGAFPHPIIAGVFWASLLPLFVAVPRAGRRLLPALGLLAALFVIYATASSTPFAAVLLVVAGFALFPLRGSLHLLRWGLIALLVVAHLWREKPVWHLVSRIDLSGGSTGYHRYVLIDRAIETVGEWGLAGADSRTCLGMQDITNQFVLEGLNGGLLALLAFAGALVLGFVQIRRTLRSGARSDKLLVWALGIGLAVHVTSFLGVSYFGQAYLPFLLVLAAIAGLPAQDRQALAKRREAEEVVAFAPAG